MGRTLKEKFSLEVIKKSTWKWVTGSWFLGGMTASAGGRRVHAGAGVVPRVLVVRCGGSLHNKAQSSINNYLQTT